MKRINIINKITSIVTIILSLAFIILLRVLNVIPFKYFLPILIFFFILNLMNVFFSFIKKKKKKVAIFLIVSSTILSVISVIGSFYLFRTILFMENFKFKGYATENYSVIVLNDSSYQSLEDLKDKFIGVFKNDKNESKLIERLNEKLDFSLKEYTDMLNVKNNLLNRQVAAIVIEDSYKSILEEEDAEFKGKTRTVYTFSLKYRVEDIAKDVDVTKNTFTIYIAGIDTYGSVSSVARSDVNMLITINPKTRQVLLTSIPRDYYVQLHGTVGYKDKLTHAGIYGVDMSVQTVEDILDVDINYYVRVNFTSLIKLVDALGGIDVYSEYEFNSNAGFAYKDGYHFSKGYNHVNGEQALAFARTRKAFQGGDRVRGKNQQAVIEAIIRKAASPAIITKYTSILDSLEESFDTNFSMNEITKLAKYQIDKMPSWTVTSVSLNGTDGSEYTYSFVGQKLYVMIPKEESIIEAKDILNKIYNGEKLEGSYGEVSDVKDTGTVTAKPNTPQNNGNSETDNNDKSQTADTDSNVEKEDNSSNTSDEVLEDHIEDILGDFSDSDLEDTTDEESLGSQSNV